VLSYEFCLLCSTSRLSLICCIAWLLHVISRFLAILRDSGFLNFKAQRGAEFGDFHK
jgi:hypothetical protein